MDKTYEKKRVAAHAAALRAAHVRVCSRNALRITSCVLLLLLKAVAPLIFFRNTSRAVPEKVALILPPCVATPAGLFYAGVQGPLPAPKLPGTSVGKTSLAS